MPGSNSDTSFRLAQPSDAMAISCLYQEVYHGSYPDPLMRNVDLLTGFLHSNEVVWVVAENAGRVVGSVVYEVDPGNRLSKVFGGVVLPEYRGGGLLKRAMEFGSDEVLSDRYGADIIYATTRTALKDPQIITEKMGYRKLGVFPNVHKTSEYETHCLTAYFSPMALQNRFQKFELHPKLAGLFDIVRKECAIGELPFAQVTRDHSAGTRNSTLHLEWIAAEQFSRYRFRVLKEMGQLPFHYSPFHRPNAMICAPDQSVEIFVYISEFDKYCYIVGIKKPESVEMSALLSTAGQILRDLGARYIETIVRADKVRTVEGCMQAGFIPSAYFPAFQIHDGQRYDYVVLCRTFEIFDFSALKLAGANREFLLEYYRIWKSQYLDPLFEGSEGERKT